MLLLVKCACADSRVWSCYDTVLSIYVSVILTPITLYVFLGWKSNLFVNKSPKTDSCKFNCLSYFLNAVHVQIKENGGKMRPFSLFSKKSTEPVHPKEPKPTHFLDVKLKSVNLYFPDLILAKKWCENFTNTGC